MFSIFQFTLSLRQYGVGGVLIGVAPDGRGLSEIDLMLYANRAAKVIDQAAHSFNYVLRSIYFSLATLAWFIDDRLFCSGQVFPDTNLGCSAITGDNPALKLCGRLWL